MLGAIQPRAIRLYGIEQQSALRTIFHRVCNHRYWIARFIRHRTPTLVSHVIDPASQCAVEMRMNSVLLVLNFELGIQ